MRRPTPADRAAHASHAALATSGVPTRRAPAAPLEAALHARVERARQRAEAALWQERTAGGGWEGELSASALSTATAVAALLLVARAAEAEAAAPSATEAPAASMASAVSIARWRGLARRGLGWLAAHQNADGGWGDTTRSRSNLSTTTLVWAAGGLAAEPEPTAMLAAAERWLRQAVGSLEPAALVRAIEQRYGRDRTFSIPILTMCALCGRLGPEAEGWARVRQLPFEVAALPQRWFGALQLPVVSYALPALIAIGLVRHTRRPTGQPVARAVRAACRRRVLAKLAALQPDHGGFLEATPLTSFVTMSLAGSGLVGHVVARRGVAFIEAAGRADGSWPIDTHLATWLTTLSCQALGREVPAVEGRELRDWLLGQQYRRPHPYTLAAPGGWAWTPLPGGVPDADDTAGALLALRTLEDAARGADADADADRVAGSAAEAAGAAETAEAETAALRAAAAAGTAWLLGLQNRDGGMPTFCRGWGRLPFDRSSPDITAHALRAWVAWRGDLPAPLQRRLARAVERAEAYLRRTQRADGSWVPLWFGHQEAPDDENPLYGTARVVLAWCERSHATTIAPEGPLARAVAWLVTRQLADGGWSGGGTVASLEETALAVEALAAAANDVALAPELRARVEAALARGAAWLCAAVEAERWREAAPIGFYFAKLWYFERLYPLVFAVAALGRLARLGRPPGSC